MNTQIEQASPSKGHPPASRVEWRTLMFLTGAALPIVLIGALMAVGRLIPPVVVLAGLYVVGIALRVRGGRSSAVLMLLPSAVLIARHLPLLPSVLANPESTVEFLTTTVTVALAGANLVAAVASLRERPAGRASSLTGRGIVAVLVALIVVSAAGRVAADREAPTPGADDVHLTTENMRFSTERINVEAGEVAVFVENTDPVLHTFTIDELGVDLQVPAMSTARVVFDAPAGTYEFVCTPHPDVMRGVLTVE